MSLPSIVIDTNVFVSALLSPRGTSSAAISAALDNFELITSLAALKELKEVFNRKKFAWIPEEAKDLILDISRKDATSVIIISDIHDCRDPKDDKFLELALDGGADVILSGDPDLLVLHPWRGIDILDPADFLDAYGGMLGQAVI